MATILIADDDESLAMLLKDFLESRSHRVAVVHDGVAASEKAQQLKPQLILMDIMMPGVYGTSAYKSLENAGLTKTIPIIFITSLNMEKVKKIVPDTSKTRLLPKPVDFAKLEAAMKELLGPDASAG